MQDEVQDEEAVLAAQQDDASRLEDIYRASQVNKSANSQPRLFLQHFQFLDSRRPKHLSILKDDHNLVAALEKLDATNLRMVQKVPLLYIKNIASSSYEYNCTTDGYFDGFLRSLGTALDMRHMATGSFSHIQDLIANCGVIYDANCLTELVFLVPSLRATAVGPVKAANIT